MKRAGILRISFIDYEELAAFDPVGRAVSISGPVVA